MRLSLITEIPAYRAEASPKSYISEWTGDRHTSISAPYFAALVDRITGWLHAKGVRKGMHIATYTVSTRVAMLAAEFAAMRLGGVVCPLHTNVTRHDFNAAIANIDPDFCLVPDEASAQKVRQQCIGPCGFELLCVDNASEQAPMPPLADLDPNSPALVISTSGTSGEPKGVVLSHHNIISIALACTAVVPVNRHHVVMSFLPVSHIFERMSVYVTMLQGCDIHLAEDPRHGYRLLRKVHPHFFTAVPRNLERIFARFHHASNEAGFLQRQVYQWALKQAEKDTQPGKTLARWLVMGRLRALFGVRLRGIMVGGAAMNVSIMRWFESAGIKVRQGYGLSEVAGVATFNRFKPGEYDLDSVGLPLPGVRIHLRKVPDSDEQEVMIESPGTMLGYLNKVNESEHKTTDSATLTYNLQLQTSTYPTGDLGYIDRKGFLHITGRRADTYKNSTGQYVSPSRIENKLHGHPAIDNVMIHGLARPFNIALILPDFEYLQTWAGQNDVHWTSPEFMIHNPDVISYFRSLTEQTNDQLSQYEKIGDIILTHEEWTVENGLLTPTLKIKRNVIIDKFRKEINAIYRHVG